MKENKYELKTTVERLDDPWLLGVPLSEKDDKVVSDLLHDARLAHELRAALLDAAERFQWRPIETAPKDGTLILTWADCRAKFSVSYWDDDDGEWCSDWREKGHPQYVVAEYWMPLPAAPEGQAGGVWAVGGHSADCKGCWFCSDDIALKMAQDEDK